MEFNDKDPIKALDELALYKCYRCKNPYCGGILSPELKQEYGKYEEKDLICNECISSSQEKQNGKL